MKNRWQIISADGKINHCEDCLVSVYAPGGMKKQADAGKQMEESLE